MEETNSHPLRKLKAKPKFLQSARKGMEEKGSVGSFTRAAKRSGDLAGHNWHGK